MATTIALIALVAVYVIVSYVLAHRLERDRKALPILVGALAVLAADGYKVVIAEKEMEKGGIVGQVDNRHTVRLAVKGRPTVEVMNTVLHELAHTRLGHVGHRASAPKDVKEIETETVARDVAAAFGIDTARHSNEYIQMFQKKDGKTRGVELQQASQFTIDFATGRIVAALEHVIK